MTNQPEQLKSAEEFFLDWTEFFDTENFEKHELVRVIQQIQLNAYKAGMRRAAQIAIKQQTGNTFTLHAYLECEEAILTLAETITEKEMI